MQATVRLLAVKVRFYGTKGYVEESSKAHSGHSAFVLEHSGFRLLCDFGQNRKGMLSKIKPDAIWISLVVLCLALLEAPARSDLHHDLPHVDPARGERVA